VEWRVVVAEPRPRLVVGIALGDSDPDGSAAVRTGVYEALVRAGLTPRASGAPTMPEPHVGQGPTAQ
jgi:hypothetical protein